MINKILIYIAVFILIWVIRVQAIGAFYPIDAIFVFVLSISIILILASLEYKNEKKLNSKICKPKNL